MRTISRLLLAVALVMAFAAGARPSVAATTDDVLAYGAPMLGSTATLPTLAAPVVGITAAPAGGGYWEVAADGGVFGFGQAAFAGSTGGMSLASPVIGMAADPDGHGYWEVAGDGGIFSFDAPFLGSTGAMKLNAPVVGMAASRDGHGYWLVGSDGGIFAFGAPFYGSTGGMRLNKPIVGMASTETGHGYWLVASDGGIFAFGDAVFSGSTGAITLTAPITGMAADPDKIGYWLVAADGGVFAFDAPFHGSAGGTDLGGKRAVGIAADRATGGYWIALGKPAEPVLRQGDRGPAVTMLQQRLRGLAYWVPVNGVYDYSTFHAVTALEKVAGLPRNGVMGTAEWAALDSGTRTHPRGSGGVEIDIGHQVLTVVRNGSPLWIFDTSTGRAGFPTPTGHFTIYRQVDAPNVGGDYRPKFYHADLAIHGYDPVPPYPFSHGCARVTDSAMDFIWASGIIPLGTGVYIY